MKIRWIPIPVRLLWSRRGKMRRCGILKETSISISQAESAVNSLGFCDEGWADAVSCQAKTLNHCSNLYYNPANAILAEKIINYSGFKKGIFRELGGRGLTRALSNLPENTVLINTRSRKEYYYNAVRLLPWQDHSDARSDGGRTLSTITFSPLPAVLNIARRTTLKN